MSMQTTWLINSGNSTYRIVSLVLRVPPVRSSGPSFIIYRRQMLAEKSDKRLPNPSVLQLATYINSGFPFSRYRLASQMMCPPRSPATMYDYS